MFGVSEYLEMLMWALILAPLYTIVPGIFDPERHKLLPMGLLLLIGPLLLVTCIQPPGTLHFCHNAGVIVLGDIPWWPAYFAVYILALLFFTCEHICMNLGKINES